MPIKTVGEEMAKRRVAEKSGNLDAYLDEMGAGDDVSLRQGYRRIDEPKTGPARRQEEK